MERSVRLGVTGWVRNMPNGSVEAVFEGEDQQVKAIVEFCRHGIRRAVVTSFDLKWEPFKGEFKDFKIRHQNGY